MKRGILMVAAVLSGCSAEIEPSFSPLEGREDDDDLMWLSHDNPEHDVDLHHALAVRGLVPMIPEATSFVLAPNDGSTSTRQSVGVFGLHSSATSLDERTVSEIRSALHLLHDGRPVPTMIDYIRPIEGSGDTLHRFDVRPADGFSTGWYSLVVDPSVARWIGEVASEQLRTSFHPETLPIVHEVLAAFGSDRTTIELRLSERVVLAAGWASHVDIVADRPLNCRPAREGLSDEALEDAQYRLQLICDPTTTRDLHLSIGDGLRTVAGDSVKRDDGSPLRDVVLSSGVATADGHRRTWRIPITATANVRF